MSARALMAAIETGDLENVKRLIGEGADVKEWDDFGYTPLLETAVHGHLPIMHWMLTEGGSSLAEQTVGCGASALLVAARYARFSVMQYLLEEQD
jgi:ankyrin repeat protein